MVSAHNLTVSTSQSGSSLEHHSDALQPLLATGRYRLLEVCHRDADQRAVIWHPTSSPSQRSIQLLGKGLELPPALD